MSVMDLLVFGLIATPAIGLTAAGVLLIVRRTRFSARGSSVALVLGILATSFGIGLALALIFVSINLGSEAGGGAHEFGTSASNDVRPTLGEKLFSEVMGQGELDYGAREQA